MQAFNNTIIKTLSVALFFLSCIHAVADTLSGKRISQPSISISISPEKSNYRNKQYFKTIDDPTIDRSNSADNIRFLVTFKNNTSKPLTIAHPFWVRANILKEEGSKFTTALYGKSELLLVITKPDNEKVTLREAAFSHQFEFVTSSQHDAYSHLTIPPNHEETIVEGWFHENARGKWDDDIKAWNVFSNKGVYKVKVVLNNMHSKASINKVGGGTHDILDIWTGQIQSNETIVNIY